MLKFNLRKSAISVYFFVEIIIDSLNKVLENNRSKGINHSYKSLNISRENISFLFNLLAFIPESVSNASLYEPQHTITTKLPPRFYYTAGLIIAYLARYNSRVLDLLFYSKAINSSNTTQ